MSSSVAPRMYFTIHGFILGFMLLAAGFLLLVDPETSSQ
jgi:hypothetical protein